MKKYCYDILKAGVIVLGLLFLIVTITDRMRDYKIQKEIDANWKSYKNDSISPVTRSIKPDTLKHE